MEKPGRGKSELMLPAGLTNLKTEMTGSNSLAVLSSAGQDEEGRAW
jgi:hypothetical protein